MAEVSRCARTHRAHMDTAAVRWNEPLSLTLSPLRGARESDTCAEAVSRRALAAKVDIAARTEAV